MAVLNVVGEQLPMPKGSLRPAAQRAARTVVAMTAKTPSAAQTSSGAAVSKATSIGPRADGTAP
jgi:hypothetical protein